MSFAHTDSIFSLSRFRSIEGRVNNWFLQTDVERFFSGPLLLTHDDMVCVYERLESYPTTVLLLSKLVSKRTSNEELKSFEWGGFTAEIKKVFSAEKREFLPRKLRDLFSLEWCSLDASRASAYKDKNGAIAATRFVSKGPLGESEMIFIRRSLVGSYISMCGACMMTFVRVNRFSERSLEEWRTKDCHKVHRSSDSFNYELEFRSQSPRPLCESMSFTIGKRDITSEILEA